MRHLISIHALLAESDMDAVLNYPPRWEFLSTLSLRRATPVRDVIQWEGIFLSTLSLRRATVTVLGIQHKVGISIHALLAESDVVDSVILAGSVLFLSTLSLRRATIDYS